MWFFYFLFLPLLFMAAVVVWMVIILGGLMLFAIFFGVIAIMAFVAWLIDQIFPDCPPTTPPGDSRTTQKIPRTKA